MPGGATAAASLPRVPHDLLGDSLREVIGLGHLPQLPLDRLGVPGTLLGDLLLPPGIRDGFPALVLGGPGEDHGRHLPQPPHVVSRAGPRCWPSWMAARISFVADAAVTAASARARSA